MKNNNAQPPLGICQRLFGYIMNGLINLGIRRLTYGGDLTKIPITDSSINHPVGPNYRQQSSTPKEYSEGEIKIQFRHSDGLEELWSPPPAPENEKAKQGILKTTETTLVHGKGAKKVLHIKDDGGETEKQPKDILEAENTTKVKPLNTKRPLPSVTSNINEKSDEFIRRKREDMRRNYNLDQP